MLQANLTLTPCISFAILTFLAGKLLHGMSMMIAFKSYHVIVFIIIIPGESDSYSVETF